MVVKPRERSCSDDVFLWPFYLKRIFFLNSFSQSTSFVYRGLNGFIGVVHSRFTYLLLVFLALRVFLRLRGFLGSSFSGAPLGSVMATRFSPTELIAKNPSWLPLSNRPKL